MSITEAVAETYLLATGKTTVLTTGSKYDKIIGLLAYWQRRWARTKGIDWNSLYDPAVSLGAVTNNDSFDIDTSSIRKLSDREGDTVRIVWTDKVGYTDYDIIDADTLKDYSYGVNKESPIGHYCAQIGSTLVFNHKFVSTDSQYGGEIFVPAYTFPDDITSADPNNNEVQVDDPAWLTTKAAAHFDRNDITRRSRWKELDDEADIIMDRMVDDNDGQIDIVNRPWTPPSGLGRDSAWN